MSEKTLERVYFEVTGQPKPKQRPRVVNGHAYTPTTTRAYEYSVGWAARSAMGPREPMRGDVALDVTFKRRGKRRADLDNLVKAVSDGCNGIVFRDDAQIVRITARVEYGATKPCVRVVCQEVLA